MISLQNDKPESQCFRNEPLSSLPSGLEFCVNCVVGEGVGLSSAFNAEWREFVIF